MKGKVAIMKEIGLYVLIVAAWFALQRWILPRMGVST